MTGILLSVSHGRQHFLILCLLKLKLNLINSISLLHEEVHSVVNDSFKCTSLCIIKGGGDSRVNVIATGNF